MVSSTLSDLMSNGSDSADDEVTDDATQDEQTLRFMRDELTRYRADIPKEYPELRKAISEWLDLAYGVATGDLDKVVSSELNDIRMVERQDLDTEGTDAADGSLDDDPAGDAFTTYPMYDARGVEDPEDAFPDDCEGCPHYGDMCPVVNHPVQKNRLDRILAGGDEKDDRVHELRQLAMDNQCHVIKDVLDRYESDLGPMLHAGVNLLMAAQDVVSYNDTEEQIRKHVERARKASERIGGDL